MLSSAHAHVVGDLMTVHCPECNGRNLREKNTAYTEIGILDWEWDNGSEAPQPAAYETDVSVNWNVADDPHPYACAICAWEGTLDQLVVKEPTAPRGYDFVD